MSSVGDDVTAYTKRLTQEELSLFQKGAEAAAAHVQPLCERSLPNKNKSDQPKNKKPIEALWKCKAFWGKCKRLEWSYYV